jgi:hypothetical protein
MSFWRFSRCTFFFSRLLLAHSLSPNLRKPTLGGAPARYLAFDTHAKGLGLFVQCFSVGECRAAARVVSLVCGAGRTRDDSSKRTITKLVLISKETPDGRRLEVTG